MALRYGEVNGHIIGQILRETVRRATVVIRNERLVFEAQSKQGHSGTMDDVFTSADTKAQEVYLTAFRECFPTYGVLGEEDALVIPSAEGPDGFYFTVDPLDGTRAFIRRQSHGVGTMVALVRRTEILSAYVGDINTEEVYGYHPDADNVERITRLDTVETLCLKADGPLSERYALLRDPDTQYSDAARQLLRRFKSHEVIGSSIGIWMAQLWKGEVGAVIMRPGWETPWDSTPILGISKKLGCAFLRPGADGRWVEYEPVIATKKYRRDHETLILHRDYAGLVDS
jgi:fructose-1,6-bisphosphatase/inositol monophosphatase family enzyme